MPDTVQPIKAAPYFSFHATIGSICLQHLLRKAVAHSIATPSSVTSLY